MPSLSPGHPQSPFHFTLSTVLWCDVTRGTPQNHADFPQISEFERRGETATADHRLRRARADKSSAHCRRYDAKREESRRWTTILSKRDRVSEGPNGRKTRQMEKTIENSFPLRQRTRPNTARKGSRRFTESRKQSPTQESTLRLGAFHSPTQRHYRPLDAGAPQRQ